jgi:hypothetical protein
MFIFYVVAVLSLIVGAIMWWRSDKIAWWEWLIGSATGFIMAVAFHLVAFAQMTSDVETHSGCVTQVRYRPAWNEAYVVHHTSTTKVGKTTVTRHWTTHHTQNHPNAWYALDTFGNDVEIEQSRFNTILSRFGSKAEPTPGTRTVWYHSNSHMTSGDKNDYVAQRNGYVEPMTMLTTWTNRVKACPSAWSFPKPAEEAGTPKLYEYPRNDDRWNSDRLLGTALSIGNYQWDQMNARIGESKQVNVIAIGFGNLPASVAFQQQAKWIGGKKNDLVLCYGGASPAKADWAEVFGWSESELCKQRLKTILLENALTPSIIPIIEAEVIKDYKPKDWTKFDYLTIEPPLSAYILYFLTVFTVQGLAWAWFHCNEFNKDGTKKPRRYGYY